MSAFCSASVAPPAVRIAATSLSVFVLACIALHPLRPDLEPFASQMSLYLIGDWGWLL